MDELNLAYYATFGKYIPAAPGESFSEEEIMKAILTKKPLKFKFEENFDADEESDYE